MKATTLFFIHAFFAASLLFPITASAQGSIRSGGQDLNLTNDPPPGSPSGSGALAADYREQMRALIIKISRFTRRVNKDFIVMTRGGLELIEKVSGGEEDAARSAATTYIRSIDGVLLHNLFFRPPGANAEAGQTDATVREENLRLAKLGQENGLQIWVTDFATNEDTAKKSYELNKTNGFIPFTVEKSGRSFDRIPAYPARPISENSNSIIGLKSARNFLFMNNPSRFDTQDDMVEALRTTNFDALVLDVFDRTQNPFTKKNVRKLQLKKIGSRRLVLAVMNISTADSSHYYWKPGWTIGNPRFIGSPAPGTPDRHLAQYWDRAWHDILTGKPDSYVYGIAKQGFDGVVLDGVENFRLYESADR